MNCPFSVETSFVGFSGFDLRCCAKEISPANPRTPTTSCPVFFAFSVETSSVGFSGESFNPYAHSSLRDCPESFNPSAYSSLRLSIIRLWTF